MVCGFIFEPIPELTPVVHGLYWQKRKTDFPKHETKPIIGDQPALFPGLHLRTWLEREDDTRLIQIQIDRLFVNWRRRKSDDEYPCFKDKDGREGLLTFSLSEFNKFKQFCKDDLAKALNPTHIELSKIDVFKQGEDWTDWEDLSKLLPFTKELIHLPTSSDFNLSINLSENPAENCVLAISASMGIFLPTNQLVFRLEVKVRKAITPEENSKDTWIKIDERCNKVFFDFIPTKELERFKK